MDVEATAVVVATSAGVATGGIGVDVAVAHVSLFFLLFFGREKVRKTI